MFKRSSTLLLDDPAVKLRADKDKLTVVEEIDMAEVVTLSEESLSHLSSDSVSMASRSLTGSSIIINDDISGKFSRKDKKVKKQVSSDFTLALPKD